MRSSGRYVFLKIRWLKWFAIACFHSFELISKCTSTNCHNRHIAFQNDNNCDAENMFTIFQIPTMYIFLAWAAKTTQLRKSVRACIFQQVLSRPYIWLNDFTSFQMLFVSMTQCLWDKIRMGLSLAYETLSRSQVTTPF